MNDDPTEDIRRREVAELNAAKADRERLAAIYGEVYNLDELRELFEVTGFMAPYVVVRRKADGQVGSLQFQHSPRFYFNFEAHTK